MAEESGFFTSVAGDRKYTALIINRYLHDALQRANGIVREEDEELAATIINGTQVQLAAGVAMFEGFYYRNSTPLTFSPEAPAAGCERIDRLIIHLDRFARTITAMLKQGAETTGTAQAPAIDSAADITVAQIRLTRKEGPTVLTLVDERAFRPKFLTDRNSLDDINEGTLYGKVKKEKADAINAGSSGGMARPLLLAEKIFLHENNEIMAAVRVPDRRKLVALALASPRIRISADGGKDWTQVTALDGSSDSFHALAVFKATVPYDSRILLAGGCAQIYRSTNEGASWSLAAQNENFPDIRAICVMSETNIIAGGINQSSIICSTDRGLTWSVRSTLPNSDTVGSLEYLGGGVVLAGCLGRGRIYRSSDYGQSWTLVFSETQSSDPWIRVLKHVGNGVVLGGYHEWGYILRSTNYGLTWSGPTQVDALGPCDSFLVRDSAVYAGSTLHKSLDGGLTWSLVQEMPNESALSQLILSRKNLIIGISTDGQVFWETPFAV